MIKELELINWRSHSHSRFSFTKGTNTIVGHIGSGKSSIVDAICFAFFGTFPELQSKAIKTNELIRNRPNRMSEATIKMHFEANKKDYHVERKLFFDKGKASQAKLYENEKLIAGPKVSEVDERITAILGLNYELFSRAVYAQQDEIDYFLKLAPRERKEKFDEMLELQKFEIARTNAVTIKNLIKNSINEKKEFSETLKKQLETEKPEEKEKKIQSLEKEKERILKELEAVQNKIKELEVKVKNLEEKNKKFKLLKEHIISLKSQIRLKETEIKKLEEKTKEIKLNSLKELDEKLKQLDSELKEIEAIEVTIVRKEKEIESLNLSIQEMQESYQKIKEKIPETIEEKENKLKEVLIEIKENEKKIRELQEQLNKNKAEQKLLETRKKEEEMHLNELMKAKAVCPVCQTALNEKKKEEIIKEKKALIEKFDKDKETLNENIVNEEKIILESKQNIERKKDEEEKIKDEIRELKIAAEKEKKIQETKEKQLKAETEAKELKKKIEGKNKERIRLLSELIKEKIRLIVEQESLTIKKTELDEKNNELNSLKFNEEEFTKETIEFERKKEQLNSLTEQIKVLNLRIKENKEDLEKITARKKDIERLEKNTKILETRENDLKVFINALEATQAELREMMIQTINEALNEIWPKLYPYKDITSVKIIATEKDYDIHVEVNNKQEKVEGILSGGERTAVALAIRIALSLVLARNFSILILDEPTHNLDVKTITSLSEMLREHLPLLVQQTFLITHEPQMEKAASGKLYKLDRNKELQEATQVIELEIR